jgi:hypothetical protein
MHFTKILIQISQENFQLQELSQGDQIRRHSFLKKSLFLYFFFLLCFTWRCEDLDSEKNDFRDDHQIVTSTVSFSSPSNYFVGSFYFISLKHILILNRKVNNLFGNHVILTFVCWNDKSVREKVCFLKFLNCSGFSKVFFQDLNYSGYPVSEGWIH